MCYNQRVKTKLSKSIIYLGVATGALLVAVRLLIPARTITDALMQLMCVLAAGYVVGYVLRAKMQHAFAVIIFAIVYGYGVARLVSFLDDYHVLYAVILLLATVVFSLGFAKYFSTGMTNTKLWLCTIGAILWLIICPIFGLYFARLM